MAKIEIRQASKEFPSRQGTITALSDVSLMIEDAQFVTIVGASGCGKSTLLNLVAGFENPTTGVVMSDGQPIVGPGPDRGVVFQQTALFPWLSVEDNVGFGLKLKANAGKKPAGSVVSRLVERVILVGVVKKGIPPREERAALEELTRLTETAGGTVTGTLSQRIVRFHPRSLIGSGKVEEVARAQNRS